VDGPRLDLDGPLDPTRSVGGAASGTADDGREVSAAGALVPLAARLRPRALDELVGHADVLGADRPLRAMLERGALSSTLLWGPPGAGKTSLARLLARQVDAAWVELSAVAAGVKEVRAAIEEGRSRLELRGRRTVLFVDEIHRFSRAQQDALLPGVEAGWVTLVGATTENPFFEVVAPLLSRCQLVRLEALAPEDLALLLRRALDDDRSGFAGRLRLDDDALHHLAEVADGDARAALTALEVAALAAGVPGDGAAGPEVVIGLEEVAGALRRFRYDRASDAHYDQLSAFIKSLRGSDPDAAVYWLTRMLAAGEDPRMVARRMVILASEDVGLADRAALPLAVAAFEALDRVGLPEARYALTHAAIALAIAPKSNTVTRAMAAADALVARTGDLAVPLHLRDTHHRSMRAWLEAKGRAEGRDASYDYPHDHDSGIAPGQAHLPEEVLGAVLYEPGPHGHEGQVAERVERLRRERRGARGDDDGPDDEAGTE
jgi:putative ATPase